MHFIFLNLSCYCPSALLIVEENVIFLSLPVEKSFHIKLLTEQKKILHLTLFMFYFVDSMINDSAIRLY